MIEQKRAAAGGHSHPKKRTEEIELNYELGFRAIKSLLTSKHHGERSVVADDAYTNDLNEQLMFDALKVVPLEDVHIDQLITLAKASRNTSSSLARVKIQLY